MRVRMLTSMAGPYYSYRPGQVVSLSEHTANRFIEHGVAEPYEEEEETEQATVQTDTRKAAVKTTSKAKEPADVDQYHTGGGWYTLPDGEKVQGKDAAREALEG